MNVNITDQSECLIMKKKHLESNEKTSKKPYLSVVPSKLNFFFTFPNIKVQEKMIEITNYYSKSCPIQILPLDTRYFRVENLLPRSWLTPGSVFKTYIHFTPDEARDYNDVLKIRYFNDQILQIQIFAKILCPFSFPTSVNFGNVPLDRAACYKIPICSYAEKKFSFAILPSKENPCVDIFPRWGHVKPGQKPIMVMIIYRPLQYISMNFQIRIFLFDLCKVPYVINFYAYTRPGLLRDTLKHIESEVSDEVQPTEMHTVSREMIKPLSKRKSVAKLCTKELNLKRASFEKTLLKQCSQFPLHALHAVNCILNSKIQKSYDEHELKGPLNVYMFQMMDQKIQKLKQFLIKADKYRRENEQAKIHRKAKVNYGTRNLGENQIVEVKLQREQAWNDYENSKMPSSEEELFERLRSKKIRQRILRSARKYPNTLPIPPQRRESLFYYCKIVPFLQTARTIVLKNRLLRVLAKLNQLTPAIVTDFEDPLVNN